MAALTENTIITVKGEGKRRSYIVASGKTIYQGAQVFIDSSGYATDDGNSGANQFVGIAIAQAEAGERVEVFGQGDFLLSVTGAVQASEGKPVYSDDSNGATMTSTAARYIGTLTSLKSAGLGWVGIDTDASAQT